MSNQTKAKEPINKGLIGLHARIDRDGLNEIAFNGWVPEYRRPQEAAAVARRFAEREGYA